MTTVLFYALIGAALFVTGLFALIRHRHLLRKILAINVIGTGVFLLFIALAKQNANPLPDPVPHAMVITGIVVAVSATALALALMLKLSIHTGHGTLPDDDK